MPKDLLFILFSFILIQNVSAQEINAEAPQKVTQSALDIYQNALGIQSPLYNGSKYYDYVNLIKIGHPFFGKNSMEKGTIYLDGLVFKDVPMLYDIVRDIVVITYFENMSKLSLPRERMTQFFYQGHNFIRLVPDSLHDIPEGFYDRLYEGKLTLYARQIKIINEQIVAPAIIREAVQQNIYFIKKNNKYYTIRNMHSLLQVLKEKDHEVQKYLKKNDIRFKADPERAIMKAVEYYDRLTN